MYEFYIDISMIHHLHNRVPNYHHTYSYIYIILGFVEIST